MLFRSCTCWSKWLLQEIRDPNNNYVKFTYARDSNEVYPSQILYTGNTVWRDNLGETAAAIRMGCGGRVRREGRLDSFRTQAISDCR